MKATVIIRPKAGILDPQGQAVESSLQHLGFEVTAARVGRVVDVELTAAGEADARAQLIESYEIDISAGTEMSTEAQAR
jgi:phosphoribosylformylglycinamidine synthase